METRKWNTVKEVLVKGGGTMEVGSYFTEHKGNGITLTIEEPVGIMKITGIKRTKEQLNTRAKLLHSLMTKQCRYLWH